MRFIFAKKASKDLNRYLSIRRAIHQQLGHAQLAEKS